MNKLSAVILILLGVFFALPARMLAQVSNSEVPMIGAEVFIEPGQNAADIDTWFKRMKESGMTITRIRMFESYMHKPDGSWDYTLFDYAFKAGDKYGIKIYANLFPATSFDDVGGFKFPRSEQHLASIGIYIKNLAQHFKQFKSLYGWVPINEPGAGHYPRQEYSQAKFEDWKKKQPVAQYQSNGYTHFDFADERFLVNYNVWFLRWLADEIHKYDPGRPIHVNDHAIFKNVAEYDFPQWRTFLTSLGGSAHASWHFDYFKRSEYAMALSANSEILRSGAGNIPWLMTELQGGNNTYSGNQAMCPTADEIGQWLWTTIGTGSKGAIFWCLNPRMSGIEAGEWAMLDFQNNPSDRMQAAAKVAGIINRQPQLFANAKVDESGINILYSRESMWVEKKQSSNFPNDYQARNTGGVMKSALGYFEALSQMGIQSNFKEMGEFDFSKSDYKGITLILSNQIAIASKYFQPLQNFVQKGGKLIVDGSTAFYDENAVCLLNDNFPMKDLFGGLIKEYKLRDTLFNVKLDDYALNFPAHAWQGYIQPGTGRVYGNEGNEIIALKNKFGHGEVLWVPSMLGLGSRISGDYRALTALLSRETAGGNKLPFKFSCYEKDILMKTLRTGDNYFTILINKSNTKRSITLTGQKTNLQASVIYDNKGGTIIANNVSIAPEETVVIKWTAN